MPIVCSSSTAMWSAHASGSRRASFRRGHSASTTPLTKFMSSSTVSTAPSPSSEAARLAALRRYRILDTDPERAFDDLAHLASHICGTPIALISLVDEDRQWFKAAVGVTGAETSRSVAFCAHAIQEPGIMMVNDAMRDERFRDNPLVTGEMHLRFYAGAPLNTPDGHAVGTLCVADTVPRELTGEQTRALDALRRQVEAQLELRRNLMELQEALAERDRAEADRRS